MGLDKKGGERIWIETEGRVIVTSRRAPVETSIPGDDLEGV